jgi:hypothetical protein
MKLIHRKKKDEVLWEEVSAQIGRILFYQGLKIVLLWLIGEAIRRSVEGNPEWTKSS